MDQLDCRCGSIELLQRHLQSLAGCINQNWAQPFAGTECTVTNGFMKPLRRLGRCWQPALENSLYAIAELFDAAWPGNGTSGLRRFAHDSGLNSSTTAASLPEEALRRSSTFCSACLSAVWQARVRAMPCSNCFSASSSG